MGGIPTPDLWAAIKRNGVMADSPEEKAVLFRTDQSKVPTREAEGKLLEMIKAQYTSKGVVPMGAHFDIGDHEKDLDAIVTFRPSANLQDIEAATSAINGLSTAARDDLRATRTKGKAL